MGVKEIQVYMDSLLVVNQMQGIFKIRNRDLWPIHQSIVELVKTFSRVSFSHVPREFNKLADAAVNRAIDEQLASEQNPNYN
jgi:ribonuclease HI